RSLFGRPHPTAGWTMAARSSSSTWAAPRATCWAGAGWRCCTPRTGSAPGRQLEPVVVGDGLAALGALRDAVSAGRPFPLGLPGARMPDTDGLTLAARIRERAALSAVRIILLTSDHRPGDPARARALRIDAQLLKPVQQDELLETIYRVMSRAQGEA